jgi:hypothetical protein
MRLVYDNQIARWWLIHPVQGVNAGHLNSMPPLTDVTAHQDAMLDTELRNSP